MNPSRHLSASLMLLASLATAPHSVRAAESYDNCAGFIDALPAVIATQGVWCLRKDLITAIASGNAITINTNNVTIDCNDFKIGGLSAGPGTQANGIQATDRLNALVRQCNIRGFMFGVKLEGAGGGGHVVEDNRFDGNTYTGISVEGDGSVVRRNLVRNTGGSTTFVGLAYGIKTLYSVDVIDNSVSGVLPSANFGDNGSDAYGIATYSNLTGSIDGNRVRGLVPVIDYETENEGSAYGIYNSGSGRISVVGNQMVGTDVPGQLTDVANFGLYCANAKGRAKDNIIRGFSGIGSVLFPPSDSVPISNCSGTDNAILP